MKKRYMLLMLSAVMIKGISAHDTTHIHPLITERIGDLIDDTDTDGSYQELLLPTIDASGKRNYTHWGNDAGPPADVERAMRDNFPPYAGYGTVMAGVVQEDAPVWKVRHHFHHALHGTGLKFVGTDTYLGGPSAARAMAFFREAVDLYGLYTESARSAAMFHFGMALHHVEDMSSPAHVHNDPHLTFLAPERDDYEGYYLPYQRLPESQPGVTGLSFAGATAVTQVDDPGRDIWGVNNPDSLVRLTHARTTYQATLAYPTGRAMHFQGDLLVLVPTPVPALPQGELAEMFPCPNGDTDDACLHWSEDALGSMAHWEINGVGGYHHQFTLGHGNAWWPLSEELASSSTGAASTPGLGVPDGVNGFYYIEQLALNNDKSDPLGIPVVPVGIRADFNAPWDAAGNPVVANGAQRPLLAFYTDHLLAPPVTYGAGFTQYWYDVANTPPYLKRVYVAQDGQGVAYHAEWQDVPGEQRRYTHANVAGCYAYALELNCADTNIEVETVGARELTTLPGELRHLSELSDVTLTLEFNEAVASIEGLAFGEQDAQGACQEGQSACLDVLSLAITPTVSDDERTWVFRLPGSELTGLNGKLVLTVRAIDKNNHRDGNGGTAGAQLDDSPATPARRMTVDAASGAPEHYPWQTADTLCNPDDPEGESGCYAYEYAQGDRNHYLLFDTSAPSGEIVIDTTL